MLIEAGEYTRVSSSNYEEVTRNSFGKILHPRVSEHAARYRWAVSEINNAKYTSTVVDAASGSGWGTHLIAQQTDTKLALGIDIDQHIVTEATNRFGNERVLFHNCDIRDIDRAALAPYGPFSAIVSFETIEHVPQQQAVPVLERFASLLEPGGTLFISTPNKQIHSPLKEGVFIPDHFYEFEKSQFLQVLQAAGFRVDNLYGQRFMEERTFRKFTRILNSLAENPVIQKFRKQNPELHRLPYRVLSLISLALHPSEEVMSFDSSGKEPVIFIAKCSIADSHYTD